MLRNACFIFAILGFAVVVGGQNKSVYTSLTTKACKELMVTPGDGTEYEGECPGTAGYKLYLLEGDLRQTITVLDPKRIKHELGFWNFFGGFSSLGSKAEWRLKGKTPVALIFRLNVSENIEDSSKRTPYLVVTKITTDEICVTDTIKPTRSQNAEARKIADQAADRPCKSRR